MLLVGLGLKLYDAYARDPSLPKHRIHKVVRDAHGPDGGPPVNPGEYRWLASYYDAQVTYPERLTLALLTDACQAAAAHRQTVQVFTYHEARLNERRVSISPIGTDRPAIDPLEPAAIVNATGAWVDETLRRLEIPSERLMGGTKGSHFVTAHPALAEALGGRAIYAEAHDGRPVFILPWAGQTLVGTTDEAYTGDPRQAVASRGRTGLSARGREACLSTIHALDGRHQPVVRRRPSIDLQRRGHARGDHARAFLQASQ